MIKTCLSLLLYCSIFPAFSQSKKPLDYSMELGMPIKIDMVLAGNFCEMRSNHFHTGLDIKTNKKTGYRLYAIEDGYISRIRVSPWGYGKAIYIQYNNGLSTVYAHCSDFPPMLDSLIYTIQTNQESAIIDENILSLKIPVKKGDIVAFSGNSGSSSAPHLHFEIRETNSEHAINPLLFDCYRKKIKDTTPPEIRGLKLYALSKEGFMIPGRAIYFPIKQGEKRISINNNQPINVDTILTENSTLGFGIYTIDKLDAAYNVCGIYSTKIFRVEELLHHQQINYMNFDVNRYLNTHKDYFAFKHLRQHIHKQFSTEINPLPIYPLNNGFISWEDVKATYKILVSDVHGNETKASFSVEMTDNAVLKSNPLNAEEYYYPNTFNTINLEGFEAILEPKQFYEPIEKKTGIEKSDKKHYLSHIFRLSEYEIPVQSGINIRIKIPKKHKHLPTKKMGIALLNDKNRIYFQGGNFEDGWIIQKIRHFGKYTLMIDTIAPTIKALDYKNNQNISKYSTLEFAITDNLSGLASYTAYINGNWVLARYDRKQKRYVIPLDSRAKRHLTKGNNTLVIKAIDKTKNLTEQKVNLIYQQ